MNTFGLIVILCATFCTGDARKVVKTLNVHNGGRWGNWKHSEFCPSGRFAVGYSMKIAFPRGRGDDTSLNGIKLKCSDDSTITSGVGRWGGWGQSTQCSGSDAFVSFALQVDEHQGNGDDTAANFIKFGCRHIKANGGRTTAIVDSRERGYWGDYGSWSHYCDQGTAICGIQTRVQPLQRGDNTALNDVRFFCCAD